MKMEKMSKTRPVNGIRLHGVRKYSMRTPVSPNDRVECIGAKPYPQADDRFMRTTQDDFGQSWSHVPSYGFPGHFARAPGVDTDPRQPDAEIRQLLLVIQRSQALQQLYRVSE